jgi:hypothetical protein
MKRGIRYSTKFNGYWNLLTIYEADDELVVLYAGRVLRDIDRYKWALYRFSRTAPFKRILYGWFFFPYDEDELVLYKVKKNFMIIRW